MQLKFSESVGYNSNVLGTPSNGAALGFGGPIGTLYSISTVGVSTKAYWEGQQFFADGSIGMYRYLADGELEHTGELARRRRQLDIRLEVLRQIDRL